MCAATATKKVACEKSCTDMNAELAEHRHLMFCNLGKGGDKK